MKKHSPIWLGLLILISITILSAYLLDEEADHTAQAKIRENADNGVRSTSLTTERGEWALSNVPQILPVPDQLDFAGEPVPLENPDIRERFEKELYITAHRYYQVIFYLKRAPRIFPQLKEALREAGLPEDFVYLAVIESDLLPTIESPAGAKGIWQFMPSTARRYGLQVNNRIDERMNIEKATRAAIQYLKYAKKKTGSWTTASAAYNMGLARTISTIKNQQTDNYYKMYINDETSRYMFRILAAKVIIEDPERYGYQIPPEEVYTYEPYKEIEVTQGIDNLVDWAKGYETSYYDLKRLNPWILQRYLPQGGYTLKVPQD
ncbi:MAG: lytic transglycosylase domain-containing protein [Bacteroidota bacterium]